MSDHQGKLLAILPQQDREVLDETADKVFVIVTQENGDPLVEPFRVIGDVLRQELDTVTLKNDWDMEMPYGCASTDFEGGVCIDWFRSDRSVVLKVPSALGGQHDIFHEFPDGHGIDDEVTAGCLAKWLTEVDDGPDWPKRGEVKSDSIR